MLLGSFAKLRRSSLNDPTSLPKITRTYSGLFSKKGLTLLAPSYTYFNKFKSPIATFKTLDMKNTIIVYKVDSLPPGKKLSDLIRVEWGADRERTSDLIYDGTVKDKLIRLYNAKHKSVSPEKIYLRFDAVNLDKPTVNDSLIEYRLDFSRLSASYTPNGTVEFFVERQSDFSGTIALSLVFLKRNNLVYMLLLSTDDMLLQKSKSHLLTNLITDI